MSRHMPPSEYNAMIRNRLKAFGQLATADKQTQTESDGGSEAAETSVVPYHRKVEYTFNLNVASYEDMIKLHDLLPAAIGGKSAMSDPNYPCSQEGGICAEITEYNTEEVPNLLKKKPVPAASASAGQSDLSNPKVPSYSDDEHLHLVGDSLKGKTVTASNSGVVSVLSDYNNEVEFVSHFNDDEFWSIWDSRKKKPARGSANSGGSVLSEYKTDSHSGVGLASGFSDGHLWPVKDVLKEKQSPPLASSGDSVSSKYRTGNRSGVGLASEFCDEQLWPVKDTRILKEKRSQPLASGGVIDRFKWNKRERPQMELSEIDDLLPATRRGSLVKSRKRSTAGAGYSGLGKYNATDTTYIYDLSDDDDLPSFAHILNSTCGPSTSSAENKGSARETDDACKRPRSNPSDSAEENEYGAMVQRKTHPSQKSKTESTCQEVTSELSASSGDEAESSKKRRSRETLTKKVPKTVCSICNERDAKALLNCMHAFCAPCLVKRKNTKSSYCPRPKCLKPFRKFRSIHF